MLFRLSLYAARASNSLAPRATCCKSAETLLLGRCAILPFDHDFSAVQKIFNYDSETSGGKKTIERFHQWRSYSSGSYFKPVKNAKVTVGN